MNIRVIRIAITLCLTVAVMVQPMLVFGAAAPCVDRNSHEEMLTCDGCGCCEVEHPGDKCCCCSDTDSTELKETAASAEESKEPRIEAVASEEAQFQNACHCGVTSPPMNHNDQRNELIRELTVRVASTECYCDATLQRPPARVQAVDLTPGSRADFSQRILCVWRI